MNKCPSYLLLHKTTPRFAGRDSRLLFCSQIRNWAGMSRGGFSWRCWALLGSVPLAPRVVPAQALMSPELSAGAAHIFFPGCLDLLVPRWLHPKVDGRFGSLLPEQSLWLSWLRPTWKGKGETLSTRWWNPGRLQVSGMAVETITGKWSLSHLFTEL